MKLDETRQGPPRLRNYLLPILLFCIAGVLLSYFVGSHRYTQRIILLVFLWAAAASSFNIISGYGGQTVFGYMMYVGTGAYTTVILFKFLGVSPLLGMWAGVAIAVLIALIIGLPTLRLHGAFFAIGTLSFPLITIPILNNFGLDEMSIPFTGHGAASMQFRDIRYYVLIASVLLAFILIIVQKIELSRFGYSLKALKQNEAAAEAMGTDTYRTKMIAFMISAGLGAIVGTLYAFSIMFILTTYTIFGIFIMIRILSITIVGGPATVWGPVIAACFLVPVGELLNAQFGDRYPGVQDIIYGLALIASIIFMRDGIWVKLCTVFGKSSSKRASATRPVTVEAFQTVIPVTDRKGTQGSIRFESIQTQTAENRNTASILKLEGVSKSFGGVSALKDVDIEVGEKKIVGIIGPNGAGKTTLFNVINGFLTPDKGRIFFKGNETTHLKPHSLCKCGIGRTFQIPQIFSNLTVIENIMLGSFNRWGDVEKAHAIAENIGQQMGLSSRLYDKAVGLTMWEVKSLEFSRALATQPKLLLVDEPMSGLNPEETNRIGDVIKMIAESGVTIIVIEHVVQSLVKIADWMVGLEDGRKVTEGTPQEVITHPRIIEAYLGAKWRERHARS